MFLKEDSKINYKMWLTCLLAPLCVIMSGCSNKAADERAQKEAADRAESIKLLQEIRTSVRNNNRPGEAFLVLNSDAVIYMADMQILGFREDFKQDFDAWKKEWMDARDSSISKIITPGTPLAEKIKEIDGEIANLDACDSSMQSNSEEAVKQLRASIATDLATLKNQLEEITPAVNEYERIAKEQDANIQSAKDSLDAVQKQIDTLVSDTVSQINEYIVSSRIQVPKIQESIGEKLFSETDNEHSEKRSSWKSGYLIETKEIYSGYFSLTYITNLPRKLENTEISVLIDRSYKQWKQLNAQKETCSSKLNEAINGKHLALVPWGNEFDSVISKCDDTSAWLDLFAKTKQSPDELLLHGTTLIKNVDSFNTEIARKEGMLHDIDARGPKFQELLAQEIKKRMDESQRQKNELTKQKESLITEATGNALDALRDEYKLKFYNMLLSKKAADVTTGSHGDFDIPADISSYVFAERTRQNKEHLVWFVKVDKSQPRIRMSNSNLVDSGASMGDYWMMTAMLP